MERSTAQLKRKLRQLKKLEITIRFKDLPAPEHNGLVWDTFFSTRTGYDASVKYPLYRLLQLNHEALKDVFEEYFYRVYFQHYKDYGMKMIDVYDPTLLSLLGLSPYAGIQDIKQRYRDLAKKYHPDHGGESARFIEVVEIYEKLMGKHP